MRKTLVIPALLSLSLALSSCTINIPETDSLSDKDTTQSSSSVGDEEKSDNEDDSSLIELDNPVKADVPADFDSALRSADSYANMMNMSYNGVYDQLTHEVSGFTPEAARYAVDNVDTDWNQNALESARSYQENLAMSPNAIYDQLTSEYGGKFSAGEAQYAIDNL